MKTTAWPMFALAFLVLLCVPSAPEARTSGATLTLDQWLDRDFVPELSRVLSEHPRFQGQAVVVVPMDGAQLSSETDALSRGLAERLTTSLLATPGINLAAGGAAAGRKPAAGRCFPDADLQYYVGIELAPAGGGRHRLNVRLLDVPEQSWVSGFLWQWQGQLSRSQQSAYRQASVDESLRGSRSLPFDQRQTDLLAARLAHELGCALDALGVDAPRVYPERLADAPGGLDELSVLVAHHLAQGRGVQVASAMSGRTLRLRTHLHDPGDGVRLVSVIAGPGSPDDDLSSAAAQAYIEIEGQPSVPAVRPALVEQRSSVDRAARLLPGPRLVKPRRGSLCETSEPWLEGVRGVASDAAVRPGECFSLEVSVGRSSRVFLLREPANCERRLVLTAEVEPQQRLRLSPPGHAAFPWRGEAGLESFYVVAAADARAADAVRSHLSALPDKCTRRSAMRDWTEQLDRLLGRMGDRVDWQGVRVRHSL